MLSSGSQSQRTAELPILNMSLGSVWILKAIKARMEQARAITVLLFSPLLIPKILIDTLVGKGRLLLLRVGAISLPSIVHNTKY